MGNPKKTKFKEALKKISSKRLEHSSILSPDLARKVENLDDKYKITIRLDPKILNAAKSEAKELGVGYQKIINDRLLAAYSLEEITYLKKNSVINELVKQVGELNKRLRKIERQQLKKEA